MILNQQFEQFLANRGFYSATGYAFNNSELDQSKTNNLRYLFSARIFVNGVIVPVNVHLNYPWFKQDIDGTYATKGIFPCWASIYVSPMSWKTKVCIKGKYKIITYFDDAVRTLLFLYKTNHTLSDDLKDKADSILTDPPPSRTSYSS